MQYNCCIFFLSTLLFNEENKNIVYLSSVDQTKTMTFCLEIWKL